MLEWHQKKTSHDRKRASRPLSGRGVQPEGVLANIRQWWDSKKSSGKNPALEVGGSFGGQLAGSWISGRKGGGKR